MYSLYTQTVEVFAKYGIEGKKRYIPTVPQITAIMAEWMNHFGATLISSVTEQTRKDIKDVVETALREGLSASETATLISQVARTKSASRALTIARTETGRASSYTMQAVAKSMNVEMKKTWVASRAGSTREWHKDANGQTVGIDEPFLVKNGKGREEQLMFPRDSSGSADNTINCRCVVKYELV